MGTTTACLGRGGRYGHVRASRANDLCHSVPDDEAIWPAAESASGGSMIQNGETRVFSGEQRTAQGRYSVRGNLR